jgi:glycosyltransferase involved in cell wall biosynthesis
VVAEALRLRYGHKSLLLCSYHGSYHAPTINRRIVAPLFNGVVHHLYRHHVDGIVTVAAYCKQFLLRHGVPPDKITVIHNGIRSLPSTAHRSLPELVPSMCVEEGAIVIGVASRFDSVKGIDFLLRAMASVRERGVKSLLLMLGEGPLRETLRSRAASLGIADFVWFVGPQTNVPEWLHAMDVFALPSLFECHSIALLEAMRAGRAIVATNVGGTPETVRDNVEALLVPPADSKALAEKLAVLAGDQRLRERLGNAARERFDAEFTEDIMKRKLADWLLGFS